MSWQVVMFNWTGFIACMCALLAIIGSFGYMLFNGWLKSLEFCWRVSFIDWAKTHGLKDTPKHMTDKDGTKFKIVIIDEEDKK